MSSFLSLDGAARLEGNLREGLWMDSSKKKKKKKQIIKIKLK